LLQEAGDLEPTRGLTLRERQLLNCFLRHKIDKEIAAEMGIGLATVHAHCAALFKKLGVHGRNEAVRKYFQVQPI
jgi:DNA-binding CsgD family transcriptional regulator